MPIRIKDVMKRLHSLYKEHGNLQVCRVGHFGEINEMDLNDFGLYEDAKNDLAAEPSENVIHIWVPNIGPDPD